MLYVLNTLTVADRTYNEYDVKKLIPIQQYGLDTDFYGGRVKFISPTETDVLLLVEYRDGEHRVIDTAVENMEKIPMKLLRELAKRRKLEVPPKTPREDLIKTLES